MEQCTLYGKKRKRKKKKKRTDNTMLRSGITFLSRCSIASFSSESKTTNSGAEVWEKTLLTKHAEQQVINISDEIEKQK